MSISIRAPRTLKLPAPLLSVLRLARDPHRRYRHARYIHGTRVGLGVLLWGISAGVRALALRRRWWQRELGALVLRLALAVLLVVVLPLTLDIFRLNLVAKYLTYAFVAIGLVICWGYGGILRLGQGVFFDHATGIVVGMTAVIEDNVSILQGVTLGGTGKETGDRHPKIRHGVLIGAGASILGNIEIGHCSKVASGSVVLKPVPHNVTVAGVPARVVGETGCAEPSRAMDQLITNFD